MEKGFIKMIERGGERGIVKSTKTCGYEKLQKK